MNLDRIDQALREFTKLYRRVGIPACTCGEQKRVNDRLCLGCKKRRARRQAQRTLAYRKAKRRLGIPGLRAIVEAQNSHCGICGDSKPLALDYSWTANQTRGLLCQHCRAGLSCFRDDISALRAAIAYLEHYRPPCSEGAPSAAAT